VDEDVEGSTPSRHPGPSQEGLFWTYLDFIKVFSFCL